MVKEDKENPEHIYQSAHSLRELTYYMTDHIKKSHKEQMKEYLKNFDELEGDIHESIIDQWHGLHDYFVKLCHHRISIINYGTFENNLRLLENIVLSIHGPIYDSMSELDALLENENPTMETVETALSLIKNMSAYEYFFKNLKHPNWLELLDQKGTFNKTPLLGENCVEPLYLLKIARNKPDKVLEIILRHSDTDHLGARFYFIKCLIDMPIKHAKTMIKQIKKWMGQLPTYDPSIYSVIKNLALKLIEEGTEKEAFNLIWSIVEIKCEIIEHDQKLQAQLDQKFNQYWELTDKDHSTFYGYPNFNLGDSFQEETESYSYRSMLNDLFPKMINKYPLKTIRLILTNLQVSISLFLQNRDKTSINDQSLYWRKRIDEKPIHLNFRNILVDFARDGIEHVGKNAKDSFPDVITLLKQYNYLIFRRLEYHAYRKFPSLSEDFLVQIDFSKAIFKDIEKNFELFLLMENQFKNMPEKTQSDYVDFIVNQDAEIKHFWEDKEEKPSKKVIEHYIKHRQKELLKPIYKYLDGESFAELGFSISEIESIELFKDEGVIIGDFSPLTDSELEEKSLEELESFLVAYEDKKLFQSSKVGLGRQIRDHIPNNPDKFIQLLDASLKQPKLHRYASFVIDGLNNSLKIEIPLNLKELLEILEEITKELIISEESSQFKANHRRDILWSVADFLRVSLYSDAILLDFETKIWAIIETLLKERSLTIEKEIQDIGKNWMPWQTRLSSVFGVSLECVFSYLSWVKDSDRNQEFYSKALKLLESLFQEPLHTTSYIIGYHITFLYDINPGWVEANINEIFPLEDAKLDFFEAAWSGYLHRNRVTINSFELLRPFYLYSIEKIKDEPKLVPIPTEYLASHITLSYIDGLEDVKDEKSLIRRFFENAPDDVRKVLVRNIGVNLQKYKEEEDFEKIKERLMDLFDFRLECVRTGNPSEYQEELQGFSYWFKHSIFDKDWTIDRYLELLRLAKNGNSYYIIDILKEYASEFPVQTLECLKIIGEKHISYGFILFESEFKDVLSTILKSGNEDAKEEVVEYINHLLKRNLHTFKDLLE